MGEKVIHITQCDICGKEEEDKFVSLKKYQGWRRYRILSDWQDGAHGGDLEYPVIVCGDCDSSGLGRKTYFFQVLQPFCKPVEEKEDG